MSFIALITFFWLFVFVLVSASKKDGLNLNSAQFQLDEKKVQAGEPLSKRPCFLPSEYEVAGESSTRFYVRQVPGDGGCLFHSLAVSLSGRVKSAGSGRKLISGRVG